MGRDIKGVEDKENAFHDASRKLHSKLRKSEERSSSFRRRRKGQITFLFNRGNQEDEDDIPTPHTVGGTEDLASSKKFGRKRGITAQISRDNRDKEGSDLGNGTNPCDQRTCEKDTRAPRGSANERMKNFQIVLAEMKSLGKKNAKSATTSATGPDEDNDKTQRNQCSEPGMNKKSRIEEDSIRGKEKKSRRLSAEKGSPSSIGNWIAKAGKLQRVSAGEGSHEGLSRKSLFRSNSGHKIGVHFFGPKNGTGSPFFHGVETLDHFRGSSPFDPERELSRSKGGLSKRHNRRRGADGVLRRTRSSRSLDTHSDTRLHHDFLFSEDISGPESDLIQQLEEVKQTLQNSEQILESHIQDSIRQRAELRTEIGRLTDRCASLKKAQELRYRSVLDVFQENYKLLGYVESNFDYVLSAVSRERRSMLQEHLYSLLRFIADNTMATVFSIVQAASRLYLRLWPRTREEQR